MVIDWTELFEKYKGLWVALADDEKKVLGAGKTAKDALEEARSKGNEAPILSHIPEKLMAYVGL
jgi:hypothetical protein